MGAIDNLMQQIELRNMFRGVAWEILKEASDDPEFLKECKQGMHETIEATYNQIWESRTAHETKKIIGNISDKLPPRRIIAGLLFNSIIAK